jgi:hypothetical protein
MIDGLLAENLDVDFGCVLSQIGMIDPGGEAAELNDLVFFPR